MVHVDPHTIKVIPAAAKRFMGAKRYAVVGRVLADRERFDNKVGSGWCWRVSAQGVSRGEWTA